MTDPALGGGEGGRRDVRWQHFYIYFVMIFLFTFSLVLHLYLYFGTAVAFVVIRV